MSFYGLTTAAMTAKKRAQLALAATLIMVGTTGCDKAAGLLDNSKIPNEIADACLTLSHLELRLPYGYKLGSLIEDLEGRLHPQDVSWESSQQGYIVRWTIKSELTGEDNSIAIQFVHQAAGDDQPYQGDECGPLILQTKAGLVNGEAGPDAFFINLFIAAANNIKNRVGTPDVTESDLSGSKDSSAGAVSVRSPLITSSEPITQAWLLGTWGPAEYNPDNNPNASCDTGAVVTFNSDGRYTDGGGSGSYRLEGDRVTYFNRVTMDIATGRSDHSQYGQPLTTRIERVDDTTLREDGALLRRCQSS